MASQHETHDGRAPMALLASAAGTAPRDTLFVMAQPITPVRSGRDQVTLHAFTPEGIRSRTLERVRDGWSWLYEWMGDPLPWSRPFPYDDDTPECARRWHESEHGWYLAAP